MPILLQTWHEIQLYTKYSALHCIFIQACVQSVMSLQIGQTLSGRFLSSMTSWWGSRLSYVRQVQLIMVIVICCGAGIMVLHGLATQLFPSTQTQVPIQPQPA